MTRSIVRGGLVVSPDREQSELLDIVVENGRIAELVVPATPVGEDFEVVDAGQRILVPGLVNAHTHCQLNLSKGQVDRWNLELLLNAFPWLTGRRQIEHHYLSAQLGAAELIRKGCTTVYDLFSEFPIPTPEGVRAVAQAYCDIGMRVVLAPMMADTSFYQAMPGLIDMFPEPMRREVNAIRFAPHAQSILHCRKIIDEWDFDRDFIRPALAPTIPHHCSDDFLVACRNLAHEFDLGIQMHVAESRAQAVIAPKAHGGLTAVAHLHRLGLLGPGFTASHAVWLNDDDMARLANCGANVSHNPGSNLRLGSGIAAARQMLAAGINLAIGTDGAATSDSLNMFEAIRLAALVSRVRSLDVDGWISAREAFAAGTLAGARALGMKGKVGALARGYNADIVFLDRLAPHYAPLNHALNQIVYAEDGTGVAAVMIAGRMVYEGGVFLSIDYPALAARAQVAADDLREATVGLRGLVERFEPVVRQYCAGLAARPAGVERMCLDRSPLDRSP